MDLSIDFDFINQKLSAGLKLRFDIGLSRDMPNSLEWLQNHNDVFVIGIEPHPVNFQSCKNILQETNFKDRCYLIEAAIDNVNDPIKKVFYGLGGPETNYDAGTSSLKKPIGRFSNSIETVYNVNTIPLFYILDNLNCEFIDFIKTDTQGNDLNVLRSLKHHIEKVIEIYSEYDESVDYENANTGDELDSFLFENDFQKNESIVQPHRNNKVEDCKYRNNKYKFYSYINDKEILITQKSIIDNSYTWNANNDYKVSDKEIIEKFISYVEDGYTILDIGAQSGCFTLSSKFYPNTKWYAFEPDTWNRNLLLSNLKLNSIYNVSVSEEALCERVGETVLNICHSHRGLNTLGKDFQRFVKEDSFEYQVKTNSIDNLFLNTPINLIKIDTEGSEYDIIMGGIQTIKKYKPKILLEYHDVNLQQCGHTLDDLNNLIKELEYEISWIMNDNAFIEHIDS